MLMRIIKAVSSSTKAILTVTEAAKILKVSADTLRNWEKAGKLIPERTKGGARRYQLSVLQSLLKEKAPLSEKQPTLRRGMISITKAAKIVGVSADTLRNWEKKGLISADRTDGGARRYSKSQLTALKREMSVEDKGMGVRDGGVEKKRPLSKDEIAALVEKNLHLASNQQPIQSNAPTSVLTSVPIIPAVPVAPTQAQVIQPAIDAQTSPAQPAPIKAPTPTPQPLTPIAQPQISIDDIKPIVSEEIVKTISQMPKVSNLGTKFSFFRYSVPALMLLMLLVPAVYFGLYKNSGINLPDNISQKVYDLAGTVEKLQQNGYKSASVIDATESAEFNFASLNAENLQKWINIRSDNTILNGNLLVQGQSTFSKNITAPNVMYGIVAGDNITISGNPQNPMISASGGASKEADTLASVSARGPTTDTLVSFNSGARFGTAITLGNLDTDPGSAVDGAIYYNTAADKFRCYINSSWQDCDTYTNSGGGSGFSGITLAGDGGTNQTLADGSTVTIAGSNGVSTAAGSTNLLTISLNLPTSGTSSETASNSGFELSSSGLSLLRGCSDGELLKWDSLTEGWQCGADNSSTSGIDTVQENDVDVVTSASTLDFSASDFDITNSPAGEGNIAIDYLNSGITRSNQPETVSAAWTFSDLVAFGSTTTFQANDIVDSEVSDTLTVGAAGSVAAAAVTGSLTDAQLSDSLTIDATGSVAAAAVTGSLTDVQISDTLTASIFAGSGSTTNAVDLATAEVAGTLSDANISDTLTVGSSGSVDWTALNNYPAGCGAGEAVTAIGDTLTCDNITGIEGDGVIGNEVTDSTDLSLTRSGSGTTGAPYTLALNLANANTWSALQTFNNGGSFTQPANTANDYALYLKRNTDSSPAGYFIRARNAAENSDIFAVTSAGVLTAGSTGAGFTVNFGSSTLSGNVTGTNIDESSLAGLTSANFSSANISQWTNNSGYITATSTDTLSSKTISAAANTISGLSTTNFTSANISQWTNNSGYITISSTDTLINKSIAAGTNTISGLTTANFSSTNVSQWTNNAGYITTSSSDTLSNKSISAATNTISGLSNLNFTSANISQWTNNSGYITTSSSDVLSNKTISAAGNTVTGLTNANLSGTAGITNANLASSSVTITAGSGLLNGGSVNLGSSATINIGAGTGITVNADDVAVKLTTSGTTGSTASNSGLEVGSAGLTLLKGCADTDILKYSDAGGWECASDVSGGGSLTVRESDSTPTATGVGTLEFGPISTSSDDFIVTDQGGAIARVVLGTKAVKTDASQALTNKTIAAGSNTISGLSTTNFSSANISQWTNDSAYLTAASSNTLTNKTFDANGTGNSITNIDNGDLTNDTLDFDKFASSMVLDEATTITAAGALSLNIGNNVTLTTSGTGSIIATDLAAAGSVVADAEVDDDLTISAAGSVDAAAIVGSFSDGQISDTLTIDGTGSVAAAAISGTLSDAQVSDTLTASIFAGSGSTTNAVDLATAEVNGTLSDANIADILTVSGSGSVDWDALNNFPVACAAGDAVTAVGAALSCASFLTAESGDGVVGNEVLDATDTTLTRSGSGTGPSPFTLGLNLGNANSWSALQTFDNGGSFTQPANNPADFAIYLKRNTDVSAAGYLIQAQNAAANTDLFAVNSSGILVAGATGSGFTIDFGSSTLSGNVTGTNIDESTLAGLTTSNFGSANISQWTNDSGYISGSSSDTLTNKTFDANGSGNSLSNIDNADLSNDTLDFDKIASALTLDEATSIVAAGVLNFSIGNNVTLTTTGTGSIIATDLVGGSSVVADAEVDDNLTISATGSVDVAALSGSISDAQVSDTLTSSIFIGSGSTTNAIDLGTAEVGGTLSDANVADDLTISSSGTVDWAALNNYPSGCGAGEAVTAVGDTLTCGSFLTSEAGDSVIGNEVTDSTDGTLTRSGSGTGPSPFTLALNLGNANSWTALQTFDGGGAFSQAGNTSSDYAVYLKRNTDILPDGYLLQAQNAAGNTDLFAIDSSGVLVAGSTGSGFTLDVANSTISGNITGTNIDESTLAGLTTSNFGTAVISQWSNDSGYITDGNTGWDNSYGLITASSSDTLTNKTFDANGVGNSISNIDNADLINDTIDFDKVASALTLDEATTISAAGALNFNIGNNVTLTTSGTGSVVATTLVAGSSVVSNAEVDDDLTISATGTVDWDALSNYPSACSAGEAITALGDTPTCSAFLAAESGDSVIGNEVVDATDGTLTRSGAGTNPSPYTLSLNLANANSWSALQTVDDGGSFTQPGHTASDYAIYLKRNTDTLPVGYLIQARNAAENANIFAVNSNGVLSAGSTGAGFTVDFGASTLSGSVTGTNIDESTLAGLTTSNFGSANISQWTNNSGYITDGNSGWDNSYGLITASSADTLTNKTFDANGSGNSISNIDNADLTNDTIDLDKVASALTLDEATTITAGGALNLNIGNNVTLTTSGTGSIVATTLVAGSSVVSNAEVDDDLTISGSGTVDFAALSNYPSACSAGEAITALGDTPTCSAFLTAESGDSVIGNEVLDATDSTLTRSGAGNGGSPYTLGLNLNNANTWTASSTYTLTDTEKVTLNATITGTNGNDVLPITLTNQTSAGTQRGLVLTNANDAADATTESLILIDNSETTGSTLTDALRITSSGVSDGVVDAIDVSDTNITNAINIGSNNIITGAATIASIELDRLDGKDAALIDANDTGTTAITGTGTLVAGATGAGFTVNFGTSTLSGSVTGTNIDESTLAGLSTTNFTSANISQWSNDSGYITDGNTGWNNSYSFITDSSTDTLTNKTIDTATNTITGLSTANFTSANISQWSNDANYLTSADISSNTNLSASSGITLTGDALSLDLAYSPTWTGIHTFTKTVTDDGSIGDINLTLGADGNVDTVSALNIDVTSANTGDADVLYGINVGNLSSADVTVAESAIRIGSGWDNAVDLNGTLLTLTELGRLDAKDADLVDTNDGVTTAITGTGILVAGATGGGFTINFGASNLSGDVTGTNIDESSLAGLTNANLSGTAGISNANLANSSLSVTAGGGLINGGSVSLGGSNTLDIGAGSGITVNANDVAVNLTASGNTGSTSSNSGLEVGSGGLTLLKGCGDNELLKYSDAGGWACSADSTGTSSLDTAYDNGGTITVDASNVLFSLSDATNDYNFMIDNATNGTIATAMAITTSGGASSVISTAIDLSDADIVTALALGSNDLTVGGATLTSTELARLDGKDAALVDANDTGTIAITGTGTLVAGATGAGFTVDIGTSTLSGSVTGTNIDESSLAGLTTSNFGSANISQWTNNSGYITDGNTGWDNSYGLITASSTDTLTNKTFDANGVGNSISNIDNADLTNDTIDFDKIASALTLDEATTITAGGALNLNIGNNVILTTSGTGSIVATTLVAGSSVVSNAEVDDDLTISSSGTVDFAALSNYPSACSAGNAITALGDTPTCSAFLTSESGDAVIGNEVTDATDGTLTRSGSGTGPSPYTLGLNLDNANTWTNSGTYTLTDTEKLTLNSTVTGTNANDLMPITLTNQTTNGTQRGIVLTNANDAANATTESLILINNAETTASTLTDALKITSSGVNNGIDDAIDVSDGNITNALNIGANNIITAAATIASTELDLLDGKTTLVDTDDAATTAITGTGTLVSGSTGSGFTLDLGNSTLSGNITGTNIDESTLAGLTNANLSGTAGISNANLANSSLTVTAGAGLTNGGSVALGGSTTLDIGAGNGITANANDVAINLTGSGNTGSTSSNSGLEVGSGGLTLLKGCADNEILKYTDAGGWSCGADATGGGSSSLDVAYNNGATVTVDAYNVLFNLSDATNDYNFVIDNATNGTITTAFAITTAGGASSVFTTAIDLSDADIVTAFALGSNDVTVGGATLTSTEFARLDGKDAALVDANDTGTIAITGTGTLTAGATGAGFTVDFGASTLSGNVSGSNIDESTLAGLAAANFTSANISQWTNNSGYITASSSDALTNKSFDANGTGNSISNIDNADLTNDTIDLDKVSASLTLDEATTIIAGGALNLNIGNNVTLTTSGTGSILATTLVAGSSVVSNAEVDDDLTISSSGTVDFAALSNYPSACSAGNAITALGDTPTCSPFLVTETGDAVIGNEVTNAADGTLTRSGSGTGGSPYTLGLNLDNSNTWTNSTIYNFASAENLSLTSDLATAGTLNTISLIATPSGTNGTTRGLFIQQANSANGNGLDTGILIDNADTNLALTTAFMVTGSTTGTVTTALDVSDGEIDTALAIGTNDITTAATIIASTELDRLDGKDAALIDANDTGTTAITGTGTLVAGASGAGFTLNFGASTLSGNISGSNIDESTLSGIDISSSTNLFASNGVTLTGDALSLNVDYNPTWTNSHSFSLAAGENIAITNTTLSSTSDTLSIAQTLTGDVAADGLSITITDNNANAVTALNYALNVVNADNTTNTSVIDALALFSNDQATETMADGIIIRHNAASGTMTDGLQIENTTAGGTITNAINIVETAGTITTGINIGANLTTGIDLNANTLINIGNAGTDFDSSGGLTLASTLTLSNNTITCTACIDQTDIGTGAVGTDELKTSTGSSASGNNAVQNVTMNDYSFAPSITCSSGNVALQTVAAADPGNTIGRIRVIACGGGAASTVRWRYVTASDHPTTWLIVNSDGSLFSVWESDDPVSQTEYPQNPNALEGTDLSEGQYFLSVEPPSTTELKVLYSKFSQSDQEAVLTELRNYVVDKRGWLTALNSLDDLDSITSRYNPSGRAWAFRFLAKHFNLSNAMAFKLFTKVESGQLLAVDDPQAALDTYSANLSTAQTAEQQQIQGADLAEWYSASSSEQLEPGDVLSISTNEEVSGFVTKSNQEYDNRILGIVTTSPGYVLGQKIDPNDVEVALAGRIPVKISTENGIIKKGDLLTSSSTPGVAMKATRPGQTLGKALENYSGSEIGTILVFFNASYADPYNTFANLMIDTEGNLLVPELKTGKLTISEDANITGNVTAANFSFDASKLITTGVLASIPIDPNGNSTITDVVNAIADAQNLQEQRVAILEEQEASNSAALADAKSLGEEAVAHAETLDQKVATTDSNLSVLQSKIDDLLATIGLSGDSSTPEATTSAQTNTDTIAASLTPTSEIATDSATLASLSSDMISSKTLTVSETLKSLGDTLLANTTIAGNFIQDGTLSITGGNEINVIGSGLADQNDGILYLQKSSLARAVDIFDGKILIDNDGGIRAQSVTVADFKVVANKISGSGTIRAGENKVVIDNTLVTQSTRVLITATSVDGAILAVTEKKDHTSFTVSSAIDSDKEITFDWWMVQEVAAENGAVK